MQTREDIGMLDFPQSLTDLYANPQNPGVDPKLEYNETFGLILNHFQNRPLLREDFSELELIGRGRYSEVWRLTDDLVLKHSSYETVKNYPYRNNVRPENLLLQFIFMSTLANYLNPENNITSPTQYAIYQNRYGHFLKIEQLMGNRITLKEYILKQSDKDKSDTDINGVRNRLIAAVSHPILKVGLNDLISPNNQLNQGNILIPENTTKLDENSELCIIDQPGKGLMGRLAILLMRSVQALKK